MLKLHTIALISHASKIMLKILQVRLQQYTNHELPDVQAGFQRGKGTRGQISNIWKLSATSSKNQESSRKTSTSALLTTPKPLAVWITTNCVKLLKKWEGIPHHLTSSWEICMQVRKHQFKLDMENKLVANQERSMSGLYIVTLLI